jgi:predicted amidohydrolase YtcJ
MGILWFGGNIYTMQSDGDAAEAVYTEDDIIQAVGTYEKLYHDYYQQIDEEINLFGRTMLPGLIDSHMHLIGHGLKLLRLDLSHMQSAEEVKEALQNRTANLAEGEWLIGEGWNENQWVNKNIIHKTELDVISPNNPVMLTRVCRHAVLANSLAMRLAGINEQTRNPQGGIIVRDEQGETTGYFLDTAQEMIKDAMPQVSQQYLEQVIKIAVKDLVSKGLVGGHTEDLFYFGGFGKTYAAFKNAISQENKFKAHLLVHHEVMDDMVRQNLGYGDGTTYVELGAIKIFGDGALGGRTAWLTTDYADDPGNKGMAIHETMDLEDIVKTARSHHLPIAVHVIGDRAAEEVAAIIKKYPLTTGARDRMIHGQILNERVLEMLRELPLIVDIQPSFVTSDFPWAIARLGQRKLSLAYAWKTMLNNGIHCAGGSDAPIEEVNPLNGIQAAVLRKSAFDGKIYLEQEQLSIYEAVRLYTFGSAYAINQETTRGVIAEQYKADFTILAEDIFQVNPERIADIPVFMTVVDGEIVYHNEMIR